MFNRLVQVIAEAQRRVYRDEYRFSDIWRKLSFPNRPTAGEIEIYQDYIGIPSPGSNLLILGATPELRDLARELDLRPVLIDLSWAVLNGMLPLVKKALAEEGVYIRGDWLSAPLPQNHFDFVIGDLFLRHVEPEEQEILLDKLAKTLYSGGKLIFRHHLINPRYRAKGYEEIFDELKNFPYREKKYEAMGILFSRLYDASTKHQRIDLPEIIRALHHYTAKKSTPFRYQLFLYEFLAKRLWTHVKKPLASQTKEETEALLTKYFSLAALRSTDEYPESRYYPIYLLIKK